jgi:mannitol/fructose-specific phosphotransferase system IIA component (Ntr-type)
MITLYDHYKLSNQNDEAKYWQNLIELVAKNCGQEQYIKDYIKE